MEKGHHEPSMRMKRKIIALLQEYFYEDYEKIQLVLGDNAKPANPRFILGVENKPADLTETKTRRSL